MKKTLFIIRHAKSSWKDAHLISDFDRPLNKRGKAAAPEMANRMVKRGLKPDLMVSSPAKRAFATAKHFAEAWNIAKKDIQKEPGIYEASSTGLLEIVKAFDNSFDTIAVFGHNPGFTNLVNDLCKSGIDMPTAAVAVVSLDADNWAQVQKGSGRLILFDYPKNTSE